MIKNCLKCGKEFHIKPYRKNTAKYCSRKCKDKDAFKNADHSLSNKYRSRCKECGIFVGEKNHECYKGAHGIGWKDEEALYRTIHTWVRRHLGKANHCSNASCIYPRKDKNGKLYIYPKRYEWANISQRYKRDFSDWMQLCPSCHKQYDNGKLIL